MRSKPYLVVYKDGVCSAVTLYSDEAAAAAEHARINNAFHDGSDPSTRSDLVYATSEKGIGVKVGDRYSTSDSMDLLDYMED
jgi:hypothetical protein